MRMLSVNRERRTCSPVSPLAKELVRRLDSLDEIHWMKLILLLFNEFTWKFATDYVDCGNVRGGDCELANMQCIRICVFILLLCHHVNSFFISNRIPSGACLSLRLIMRTASAVDPLGIWPKFAYSRDNGPTAKAQRHAFWRWFLFISAIRPSNWFRMRIRRTHCERPPIGNCLDWARLDGLISTGNNIQMSWFDDWFIFCVFYDSLARKSFIFISVIEWTIGPTSNVFTSDTEFPSQRDIDFPTDELCDVVHLFIRIFSTKNMQTFESKLMLLQSS